MIKIVRWIAGTLFSVATVAAIEFWTQEFLAGTDLNVVLETATGALESLRLWMGADYFSWVTGALLGIGIGVFAHWAATRFDATRETPADRFTGMHNRLSNVAREISTMTAHWRHYTTPDHERGVWHVRTYGRYQTLQEDLRKLKIHTPKQSEIGGDIDKAQRLSNLLELLSEYARAGQMKEARVQAQRLRSEVLGRT